MAANACLPSTSLQYRPKANTLHRRYGQPVLAQRFWKQWLEKEPMCSTEVIMEMTFTFVTSLVIWLPFSSQITSGGKKCNKWKFDKRTSLSPHFQLHCLCFQQPAVNPSVKILDGKFQKWAVLMFWIPCCTGQNDELCWPTLAYPIYESLFGPAFPPTVCYPHSDQRILPLGATLTVINSVVLGREAFMPNSELPVVSGIHRKSWHVCFVEGHGEVMYFAWSVELPFSF